MVKKAFSYEVPFSLSFLLTFSSMEQGKGEFAKRGKK